ncbi:energy transducer TonB [Neolewinella antarctica]|uniref:TonB family protein n=1 Tax=Neolewinella antarctica TaxID=442734 RepID=A0ABX0XAY0_9BACT|nr:energy transducer TonB [Neolewinella antarctica]NJC26225.1 TonB family protein [Neolewinella antarctica]
MKLFFTLICCFPLALIAQAEPALTTATDSVAVDTTIYQFADEAPRFPTRCEGYDTTATAKVECSDIAVLAYVNKRVGYPVEARNQGISGTAVISFLIERNGIISRAEILRDPGAGLGVAAARAVIEMAKEVRWRPAFREGKPVRFLYTLPIRFKLEEPKPYVLSDRDTIYTEFSKPVEFTGPSGSLVAYLTEQLTYPTSGEDSCRIGDLDVQLLVTSAGAVQVQDIIDYNDLGTDFTFEAIRVATRSRGQWSPAEYDGRPVTAAYDVALTFVPESAACASTIADYNDALGLINEAQVMAQDSNQVISALAKMDEAVIRFPRDGRFRIVRGQTRLDNNMLGGACEDLTLAKAISLVNWYDGVLPLLCKAMEE